MSENTFDEREALLEQILEDSIQGRSRNQAHLSNIPLGSFIDTSIYDGGLIFQVGEVADNIPKWTIYPSIRDRALRQFFKTEPIISGAVYSLTARLGALSYNLSGLEEYQDEVRMVFDTADYGNGLRTLIKKTIQDLLTQDNGAFWELIGLGAADKPLLGGIVTGVNYLDPAQCYRTFDPEYPVLYIDPITGTYHKLHRTRIVSLSNMTQPNELARGIGFSALSRLLLQVQMARAVMQLRYEKASGQFERAIGYGTGLTMKTLNRLMQASQSNDDSEGLTRLGKIPFFVSMRPVELNLLDLASIPDGFDVMDETTLYVYIAALCFGVDAREFWVATQSGATKADASIQNMKARGKGLADLITTIEDAINKYIIPAGMEFEFDFIDDERDAEVANQRQVKTNYLTSIKNSGALTGRQLLAMLIHEGVLDEKVLLDTEEITANIWDESEHQPIAMQNQEDNNPDKPIDEENGGIEADEDDEAPSTLETDNKALRRQIKSYTTYRRAIRNVGRSLLKGTLSESLAIIQLDSAIRRGLTQAFLEGLESKGISRSEMSQTELNYIQQRVVEEQSYVTDLVNYISTKREDNPDDRPITLIESRLDIWANRYNQVKAKGELLADKNQKKMWKFDATKEHCVDCFKLNGRVYRAEIWDKYDIQPQSSKLACFGGHCGCSFEDTDKPVTSGRPPSLARG